MIEKRLFRNEHDKMIAGVASGLADYMQVEITIVRLLFVLSAIFMAGLGLVAYIVMWIIVPVNSDPAVKFSKFNDYFKNNPGAAGFGNPNPFEAGPQATPNWTQPVNDPQEKKPFETQTDFSNFPKPNNTARTVLGLVLVVFGCFFMLRQFDLIPDFFRLRNLAPIVLIAIGVSIIAKSRRKSDWAAWQNQQTAPFSNQEAPANPQAEGQTNATEEEMPTVADTTDDSLKSTTNTENPLK
ncbi:phage shock protein C [Pedobacter sp. UYP30]|uniref:PspC domain-containing protein n=1 Tax=Pedobacter sp. UYP30 TaxID=1756400 RepID=UPI0033919559